MKAFVLVALPVSLMAGLGSGCDRADPAGRYRIEVRELAELGQDEGPGILGRPGLVLRVPSGDWLVQDYLIPGRPKLFGPTGEPKYVVANQGEGPSEFGQIVWMITGPGDSVYFVDRGNGRLGVRSPDLRPARTEPVYSFAHSIVVFPDGGWVTATRGLGGVERPLVYRSPTAAQRGLGHHPGVDRSIQRYAWFRTLAVSTDTSFWAAEFSRHVVREWSTSGRLLREIIIDEPWFPDQDGFGARPDMEPRSAVLDIDYDSDGLLWFLVVTADSQWEASVVDGTDPYGRGAKVVSDIHGYYDTIIEIVDPSLGQVVGRLRMDEYIWSFAASRTVYTETTSPAGSPTVTVWELTPVRDGQ